MQRYVEKCREIQRNAAVLHHILGAVAHHSLEPRRHSNIPPQPGHHSSLIGDMAVLACVKLCLLHLRVVVEILGDKAIEWFLDMIITNSNDTIVTSTMRSCIKCNALNNQGGTHGSDEL